MRGLLEYAKRNLRCTIMILLPINEINVSDFYAEYIFNVI